MADPIKDNLEKQRQQFATFVKLLEKYSENDQAIEISVTFKNTRFNNEDRTTKVTADKHSMIKLEPMLQGIMHQAEKMFLQSVELLRELNSKDNSDVSIHE